MNVQEKMTMLKCYAYQKRESQGFEGKEAGMLEGWIDEDALAGEVTPEEIDQACRLSEYEIMYFNDEPFLVPPESREEILQWLQDLTQSSKLAEKTKEQIREAHRLLAAE
jgi:hypothetical protein